MEERLHSYHEKSHTSKRFMASKQTAAKNNNNNNKQKKKPQQALISQQQQQINSLKQQLQKLKIPLGSKASGYVPMASMSKYSKAYLHALADPFEAPPCILPSFPALLVRPVKVWAKGTFSTVSAGAAQDYGFAVLSPYLSIANDFSMVVTNSNALATKTIDLTTGGASIGFGSNSEYNSTNFGQQLAQYRVVAAGLRIRNITPNLTKGGQTVGLAEPSHASVDGLNVAGFDLYLESARHSAKDLGSWIQLVWRPVDTDDADFNFTFPTATSVNGYNMGFQVVAPAGNPQSYEFEGYAIIEVQGKNVVGKIPSIADTKGFEAINNTIVASRTLHIPHVRDERIVPAAQAHANNIMEGSMSNVVIAEKKKDDDKKTIAGLAGGLGTTAALGVTAGILGLLGL